MCNNEYSKSIMYNISSIFIVQIIYFFILNLLIFRPLELGVVPISSENRDSIVLLGIQIEPMSIFYYIVQW